MLFHDWISVKPFNNIQALKAADSNAWRLFGSCLNGFFVLIPLMLTLKYFDGATIPLSAALTIFSFYFFISIGTILSWWLPYFFGSSNKHKANFKKFADTHHFLPPRGDHVVPNTLHVILHLQVWVCLGISMYYLIKAI